MLDQTRTENFGVVQFMTIESFKNGVHLPKWELAVDDNAPSETPSCRDWPRIHTAIQRDGLFVIETKTPTFTATLRFNPKKSDAGDYEIKRGTRGGLEKGRTTKVLTVEDVTSPHVAALASFPFRYAVSTIGADRPHSPLVWLVGMKSFREMKVDEMA